MKKFYILVFVLSFLLSFNSCKKRERVQNSTPLGTLMIDLNANEDVIRKKESLIGNLVADAFKKEYDGKNMPVDFVLVNGGSIRFSLLKRPNGIYPAGVFTSEMADEILPFGNTNVSVKVTGKQLKAILERALAQYPLAKGPFMQVSKEVQILVDTTQAPQVLNIDQTAIVFQGNRIVSIKINSIECDSLTEYKVGVSDFIADGNDGYVTFKNIPSSLKVNLGEDQVNALKEYVIINSPIEPKIEGRILFQ